MLEVCLFVGCRCCWCFRLTIVLYDSIYFWIIRTWLYGHVFLCIYIL